MNKYSDLENVFKSVSIDTWDRISFSRTRKGFKIYETTITQNLIFELLRKSNEIDFGVKLLEAKSEKTNGNDIECFIEMESGYLFFPIQAKIIYKQGDYPKIKYSTNKVRQIDSLINYANKMKGIPLYFLYNYVSTDEINKNWVSHFFGDIKLWGVTYIKANYIKANFLTPHEIKGRKFDYRIPSFWSLHPDEGKPFHNLLDFLNLTKLELEKINNSCKYELMIYDEHKLLNDDYWCDMLDFERIGKFPKYNKKEQQIRRGNPFEDIYNRTVKKDTGYDDSVSFNPKFRLIISK